MVKRKKSHEALRLGLIVRIIALFEEGEEWAALLEATSIY